MVYYTSILNAMFFMQWNMVLEKDGHYIASFPLNLQYPWLGAHVQRYSDKGLDAQIKLCFNR